MPANHFATSYPQYGMSLEASPAPLVASGPLSPARLFNVEGLVAVVTGAGTGIGLQIAKALESNGATVYMVGRRLDVLKSSAREHNKYGKLIPVECDITSRSSLLSLVEVVQHQHGYIDLLINNAGIARNLYPSPLPGPTDSGHYNTTNPYGPPPPPPSIKAFQSALWDSGSVDDFADTFATNVTAVYYTTVAFLDLLHKGNTRRQKGPEGNDLHRTSQVLSVSSSGGFRLDRQVMSPSYTLAKSACTHLGRLLADLLAPWNIRSNVLAPGVWPSEMTAGIPYSSLTGMVPLKRAGTQEDMAGVILFLASAAGAYVNGAVWLVDGGRLSGKANNYAPA